jgi:nucleotide-binding universal stress UspA family protein
LTTAATFSIFAERFTEGAWTYFIFIPLLYAIFTYFRNQMGEPSTEMDYLGQLDAAQLAGFGFGQYLSADSELDQNGEHITEVTWQPDPIERSTWRQDKVAIQKVVVLLDSSPFAALALPLTKSICKAAGAEIVLLSSVKNHTQSLREQYDDTYHNREIYLTKVVRELKASGLEVGYKILPGHIADATATLVQNEDIDLVITSTSGKSGSKHWVSGGVSRKLIQRIPTPIILVQTSGEAGGEISLTRILVALDGSIYSERTLPYARALAKAFNSEIILMSVPAVPDMKSYRAPAEFVQNLRIKADANMRKFIKAVAKSLRQDGLHVQTVVSGSIPAQTIVRVSEKKDADLIMLTSRGRGGLKLMCMGSVAEEVVRKTNRPVFMMPIPDRTD